MMDPFDTIFGMGVDVLSVEENSDGHMVNLNQSFIPDDYGLNTLFDFDFTGDINSAGFCEPDALAASITTCVEPNEFNQYFGPTVASQLSFDIDQNLVVHNRLPVYNIEEKTKPKTNKKPILLSSSVDVGTPQRILKPSHKIEIVYPLEATYRARYKSDYFAQNGVNRKPRYVSDRFGNHYVTLKVPIGIHGKIRVDWVTVGNANGDRYSMPYCFQDSNESSEVPDCNPIFFDIKIDKTEKMKIYLVLIKAKQDALKSLQPLQPFHPLKDAFGKVDKRATEKVTTLTPKKLIEKYQLGKSQLAFTFCALTSDGRSCIPEWDTTVYSTVLEEEGNDNPTSKTVSCPNCSCAIAVSDDGVTLQETITNKRKQPNMKTNKSKSIKKQKKSLFNGIFLLE